MTYTRPASTPHPSQGSDDLHEDGSTDGLPAEAVLASLGCGSPTAVADLREREKVLDLGSGGGVVTLSTDKPAVLSDTSRVLVPGGRTGISDVVAEDDVSPAERAERGSYVGCIAGALSRSEYLDGVRTAGLRDASVVPTDEVAPGLHGAVLRATGPA